MFEARQGLILSTDLQLLYLIIPSYKGLKEPNWEVFIRRFKEMSDAEKEVSELLKIDLEGIMRTADIRPALPKELKDSGNDTELAPAILYG